MNVTFEAQHYTDCDVIYDAEYSLMNAFLAIHVSKTILIIQNAHLMNIDEYNLCKPSQGLKGLDTI